jgi:N6-L-threonylcarbamoyladenine synthase
VLYHIRDNGKPGEKQKIEIAREFEDAVCDVLIKKTLASAKKFGAKSIIVGGGVSANKELARRLKAESPVQVSFPGKGLSTDNAIMIGIAGSFGKTAPIASKKLLAQGNLPI